MDRLLELPIIKIGSIQQIFLEKIATSETDNGYRTSARLNASLSSTFIIFVLLAELRLAGSCMQAKKNEKEHLHFNFFDFN